MASRGLPWGLPNAFLLGCSFSGTQQRVEMEQMLRDEGWSDLGLECDGKTRVKDVLEQSHREFWGKRASSWTGEMGSWMGSRSTSSLLGNASTCSTGQCSTSQGTVHRFGAPYPRSISEGPVRMAETWGPFPSPFWEPKVDAAVGLSREVCAQLQLPRVPITRLAWGKS